MEFVTAALPPPGQCPVMFCIATDHQGGTQHHDGTGTPFVTCVHGNHPSWGPCRACGYGWDNPSDKVARVLDKLTVMYHAAQEEFRPRRDHSEAWVAQLRLREAERRATLLESIGAVVNVRLGRDADMTGISLAVVGRAYVDSIPPMGV
jgi:hypothetical protein